MLQHLLSEKTLYLPNPRHPPHIRAVLAFAHHPWKLVGPQHQRGKQEVPSASGRALLGVQGRVIAPASPSGQFRVKIETPLSCQLGAHHSGVRGQEPTVRKRRSVMHDHNITVNLFRDEDSRIRTQDNATKKLESGRQVQSNNTTAVCACSVLVSSNAMIELPFHPQLYSELVRSPANHRRLLQY